MCKIADLVVKASVVHFEKGGASVILCVTPALKVQTVDVEISSDGSHFFKTGFAFMFIPDITIASVTPTDVLQGNVVEVVGNGLHDKLICLFGNVGASKAIFVNSTALKCRVPELSSPGSHAFSVRSMVDVDVIGGFQSSNTLVLKYHLSVNMHSLKPTMGPSTGGTKVKIFASNLNASDTLICRFRPIDNDGNPVSSAIYLFATGAYLDSKHISCATPDVSTVAGGATALAIDLMGNDNFVLATSRLRFHLHPSFAIGSFRPISTTTSGGSLITVSGTNFVPSVDASCKFAGSKVVKATYISDSMLQCTSPELDMVGDVELAVAMNGVDFATAPLPLKIQKAIVLAAISPAEGPVSGGSVITLRGSGFTADSALHCFFGRTRESPVIFVSETELRCTTPRFVAAKTISVELALFGTVVSRNALSFTLNANSVLEGIFPGNGPADGGTVVKVFGVEFNTSSTSIQISFGKTCFFCS